MLTNVVWVWCLVQTLQKVSISYKHSFVLFLFQLISSPLKAPSKLGNKKNIYSNLVQKKKYQSDIKIHSHSLKNNLQSEVNYLFLFNCIFDQLYTKYQEFFNTMLVLMSLIKQYKELLHLNAHNLPVSLYNYINTKVLSLYVQLSSLCIFSEVEGGLLSLFLWILFVLHVLSIFAVNGRTQLVRRNLKRYNCSL